MVHGEDASGVPALKPPLVASSVMTRQATPAEGPPIRFGVTNPISLRLPNQRDRMLTQKLEAMMRTKNLYETVEGQKQREFVLEELTKLLCEWVSEAGMEHSGKSLSGQQARLFTFGSYRLGVVSPGGDIDALCVVPSFVSREAFFDYFLAKLQQDPNVTKLQPVPDAFTPIIKLEYAGIDVDLLFARLAISRVPDDLTSLSDDNLLKNVDDKTVRSLNGCRVAEDLLRLVPNVENFISTLRFIKYWAKQRGIYSNVIGFLGGVSWALLVARICQLFPYAVPSQLVVKFFVIYARWDWSKPIVLCAIKEYPDEAGLMSFQVWSPKNNPQDRYHIMPIITPSFPSMNSTHNVTLTTRSVIISEVQNGLQKIDLIRKGKAEWESIVEPFDFFGSASHFLEFVVSGTNPLACDKWHGWFESKLRLLIKRLETYPMISTRVCPDTLHLVSADEGKRSAMYFAIHFDPDYTENTLELCTPLYQFIQVLVYQWADYEKFKNSINLSMSHLKGKELPAYVTQYRRKILQLSPSVSTEQMMTGQKGDDSSTTSLLQQVPHIPVILNEVFVSNESLEYNEDDHKRFREDLQSPIKKIRTE